MLSLLSFGTTPVCDRSESTYCRGALCTWLKVCVLRLRRSNLGLIKSRKASTRGEHVRQNLSQANLRQRVKVWSIGRLGELLKSIEVFPANVTCVLRPKLQASSAMSGHFAQFGEKICSIWGKTNSTKVGMEFDGLRLVQIEQTELLGPGSQAEMCFV